MTVKRYMTISIDEAVDKYLAMAVKFGDTQRARSFEAGNEFATELGFLGRLLRESGDGQRLLLKLLDHDDPYVRIWASKDCLFFKSDAAVPVLEEIERAGGLLGTTARITLSEWGSGRLFKNP